MRTITAIFVILSSIIGTCYGQKEKIVERSASRTPEWLGISDIDIFCVSATAETLDSAQKKCLTEIQQHIVNSIAINISSNEIFKQDALVHDNITTILTNYTSHIETASANMPYLCNISLSNAVDIYWERRYVKQHKYYYYTCYIRYPFPEQERHTAINDFMRIDKQYESRLEELQRNFYTFTDLSYIDNAVNDLDVLIRYFFDTNRRHAASSLQNKYLRARQEVELIPKSSHAGYFCYNLLLHGRQITTATVPILKSDYATNLRVVHENNDYVLLYDAIGIDGDENTITITYPFGKDAKHTVIFDPMENKIAVQPYGTIVIIPAEVPHNERLWWDLTMPVYSRTDNKFEVEHIEMNLFGSPVLVMPPINNHIFHGKGKHMLSFRIEAAYKPINSILAEGFMRIRNPHDQTSIDIKFTLPYKINF